MAVSSLIPQHISGKTQPGHSLLGEMLFAFIGVATFGIVAQTNEKAGKVLLMLMLGFLVIWFVIHGQAFSGVIQRIQNLGQ